MLENGRPAVKKEATMPCAIASDDVMQKAVMGTLHLKIYFAQEAQSLFWHAGINNNCINLSKGEVSSQPFKVGIR